MIPVNQTRWRKAMGTITLNHKERQIRGEYLRQIKSVVPNAVGIHTMSLMDLHDMCMSINICECNRIAYAQGVRK